MESRIMQTCFCCFSSVGTSFSSNFSSKSSSPKPFSFGFPQMRTTRGSCLLSTSKKDEDTSGFTYKDSSVDIDAGTELIRRILKMAPEIGGFSGRFPMACDSFVVLGMDGVETKLKLAFETGIHETVGIDLVAMNVNDIVTCGAKPMGFLDYYGAGRLDVDLAEKVIKGIVDGVQQSGYERGLLGGETAEMPGFYVEGEYNLVV